MPGVIPFIPLIISGAMAGTELGMKLAGVGQPSPGEMAKQQQDAINQQKIADAANAEKAKAAAVAQATPDAIEAGGGSLLPSGFMSLAGNYANAPGDVGAQNSAYAQIFGANAPNTSGSSGAVGDTGISTQPLTQSKGFDPSKLLEMFFGGGMSNQQGDFAGGYV